MPKLLHSGPPQAKVLVVGDAPNQLDRRTGIPFSGQIGKELHSLLEEGGINPGECHYTYALDISKPSDVISFKRKKAKGAEVFLHDRPVDPSIPLCLEGLEERISSVKPEIILAFGQYSLWMLTGETSIAAWRGSMLDHHTGALLVPTYDPGLLFRQAELRHIMRHDVRRAAGGRVDPPEERFTIRPSFDAAMRALRALRGRVAWDIETTAHTYMVCIGFAWSPYDATSIPLIRPSGESWWTEEEEYTLIQTIKEVAHDPTIENVGQNFEYDNTYFAHHYGFTLPIAHDTLHLQHLIFPGQPKNLSYLSSLYLPFHRHWKDDEKDWSLEGFAQDEYFIYNCRDAVKTWAIVDSQLSLLNNFNLHEARQLHDISRSLAFELSLRGVRTDPQARAKLALELGNIYSHEIEWLSEVCGQEINPKSPKLMEFFYEDLGLPTQRNYKTGQPTLDDKALENLAKKEPLLTPIVRSLQRARSVSVVKSTFVDARLDWDGRARSSYNASGTETFRWSSSKNAFGTGMNLQNIPRDAAFGSVRNLFIPDRGKRIHDADLAGADAHVVAAIAASYGDSSLLVEFNEGGDQHMKNARGIWGESAGGDERQLAKVVVHASNYGASAKSVAINTGISVKEAELFQAKWFSLHPGIKRWHEDIWYQLQTTRTIHSRWGFQKVFFGRVDQEFKEALAWEPQHTVAITTNLIAHRLRQSPHPVELLMQVHDSIVFQTPLAFDVKRLNPFLTVPIPFDPPLCLKMKVKSSHKSWGDCE